MAYRDFKEKELKQKFSIQKREEALFNGCVIQPVDTTLYYLNDVSLLLGVFKKCLSE